MAMTIQNVGVIARFVKKHRDAAPTLNHWKEFAEQAVWRSIVDVRSTFPTADGVRVKSGGDTLVATVFNIKSYRLITQIDFSGGVITIREILTHGEYDRNLWKERL